MSICKDCLHIDVCKDYASYDKDSIISCDNFKPKADFIEVNDEMIIYTKDKWLLLNMESNRLGEAIKRCVDCLTKDAKGGA